MRKSNFSVHLLLLVLVAALSSCSPERNLARKYATQAKDKPVFVLLPTEVWLVNQKSDYPDGSFTFDQARIDPQLLENTLILPKLSRQGVLRLFGENFINELRKYGLKVFTEDQTEAFMATDTTAYILNLAQIELQEYYSPVEDEVLVGETVYTYDFTINGFNLGLWLELNKFNDTNLQKPRVLFATHDLLDRYDGYFTMKFMTGKVDYKLKVDTLSLERVNNFIAYLGRLYAAYTFDYMMNAHVERKLGPAVVPRRYFRWDPYNKTLKATTTDRFIPLEE
ncbi:MAG: hypothetical protein IPM52_02640 [Bacteroidetes bacterium]|nr:hypothetical protein [Bacteroidota bacterium]